MQKNNPYGFTGQRFEPELRMYSFAYRTYNPMSMRWMTPDPVRDGTNWYQYVSGDPVNLWDPLGLHWAGGMNIEYPEDYNSEDYSLESSVEKTKEHMEIVPNEVVWETVVSINDTYSDLSDSFGLSQGEEYLTALSTSGIPVVQETASTVLGTKKVLDYISMGISFVDTVYVEEDDC